MTAIYRVALTHARRDAPRRTFRHRTTLWLVDLAVPPRLPWWLRPLARFHGRDHLGDPRRTIRANLTAFLAEHDVHADGRILMLANAAVLGRVFNPLSVFWCHRADGTLACVVAEVHNTYQQRHRYLLFPDADQNAVTPKDLYVSPFQRMGGEYAMRLPLPDERLALSVTLRQAGGTPLVATLRGTRVSVTARSVLRTVPATLAVSALIRCHGIALWLRRTPITPRPEGVR